VNRFAGAFAARSRPPEDALLREPVGEEGAPVRAALAASTADDLSVETIRTVVESNLYMLAPETFRYFLPAFLAAALDHYDKLSVFASELIGALTEPAREDVVTALDRAAAEPGGLGPAELLRRQQLEWFDAGTPSALFRDRVDGLTRAEGAAVLAFLDAFAAAHGADFPFGELDQAIDRHWARYRDA
jgi:hypothetical protein